MSTFPPGRAAAVARLAAILPQRYARSRNFIDGAVTRLSPYLRHGVLSLAEVRDAVIGAVVRPGDAYKLVQELGWRDYWRRVYGVLGDRIHGDLEAYKTGHAAETYATELPDDVPAAATGLVCIDTFVRDLIATGYVHNHARMWFAAYLVHHRRVAWQAGARMYLTHLLDGDPASNSLSWQWVASTFGGKPYIFNRENLERYTGGTLCARCPLAHGGCPFDASYSELDARLFPHGRRAVTPVDPPPIRADADPPAAQPAGGAAIVWTHPDALSDTSAARRARPDAPVVVAGIDAMRERDAWAQHRSDFVDGTVDEFGAAVRERPGDDAAATIVAFARAHHASVVIAEATPDPLLRAIAATVAGEVAVQLVEPARFARCERPGDLRRFSRYWARAATSAFTPSADSTG